MVSGQERPGTATEMRCYMSWAGPFQYDIGKSRNAQQAPAEVVFDDQIPTLLCLSHLRWSFVYQRPQHLMSRFARDYNVLFHEEPIPTEDAEPWLEVRPEENGEIGRAHV